MEFRRVDAERIERTAQQMRDFQEALPDKIAVAVTDGVQKFLDQAGYPELKEKVEKNTSDLKVTKTVAKVVVGSGGLTGIIIAIVKLFT